jgi:hypothetical protein
MFWRGGVTKMLKVKDNTIHVTRGDIGAITVTARENRKGKYTFQAGDVVRLTVVEKNNYNDVKLRKSVTVEQETKKVVISLDKEDTTIGDVINKEKEYWYEIELNPEKAPQTIIGHDEDGAKLFILYPEGSEIA